MSAYFPIGKGRPLAPFSIHKYKTLDNYRRKNKLPRGRVYHRLALLDWASHGNKLLALKHELAMDGLIAGCK